MLQTQLPVSGLTWLVLISTVYSTISSTLSCFSTRSSAPSLTWRRLWTGVSRHLSDTFTCLSDAFTCADPTACWVCAQERRDCAEASYRTMLLAQQVDSGAFVGLCEGLEVLEGMRACVGR